MTTIKPRIKNYISPFDGHKHEYLDDLPFIKNEHRYKPNLLVQYFNYLREIILR